MNRQGARGDEPSLGGMPGAERGGDPDGTDLGVIEGRLVPLTGNRSDIQKKDFDSKQKKCSARFYFRVFTPKKKLKIPALNFFEIFAREK
jgi:hypothetical protein